MGIVQNGYDQHGNAQDDLEFFVCTHKAPPLSARLGTGWEHVPRLPGYVYYIVKVVPLQWDQVSRKEPAVLTVIGDFAEMFDPLLNNLITVGLNHSHDTP